MARDASRSRAEKLTHWAQNLRSKLGLERFTDDPEDVLRIEDVPLKVPFPYMPTIPAIGIYCHPLLWLFKTAYDINSTNVWTEANSGTGTVLTVQDERGGIAKFTNGAGDNNYYYYFSKYENAKLQAGKSLYATSIK